MSLLTTPLLTVLRATPAEPRSAGPQARLQDASQDPSQAWADALAQATATSDSGPAIPARSAQPAAMTGGEKSTTAASPGEATETPTAPSGTGTVPIAGLDDQAKLEAELTLQTLPQVSADGVTTLSAPEQGQDATGVAAPLPHPQAPPARQPVSDGRSTLPERGETVQDSRGRETAAIPPTPSPSPPSNGARDGQSATAHKDERRHHTQALDIQSPAALANPAVTPATALDARVAAVAMAAPLPPNPAPTGAQPVPNDGSAAAPATLPGPLATRAPLPAPERTPPPIITRADTTTDAAMDRGAVYPPTTVPTPAAGAPPQAAAVGRESAVPPPDIAPAPSAGSLPPAPPASAEPPARRPSEGGRENVTPAVTMRPPAGDLASTAPSGRVQTPLPTGQVLAPAPAEVPSNRLEDRLTTTETLPDKPAIAPRTDAAVPAGLPTPGAPLLHQIANPSGGTSVPVTHNVAIGESPQPAQSTPLASSPGTTSEGASPAVNRAAPQPAGAGADKSPANGRGLFADGSAPAATTAADPAALGTATAGIGGNAQAPGMTSATVQSQPLMPSQSHAIPATATALAASVVAMAQSGQSTSVLRLDPPGLGALSIHIALTANATVNVVFVPSVPQTAQMIHSALPDLHHAMASAGLSLGEAQVGGGTGGNANGQARNQTGDGNRVAQTTILSRTSSEAGPALAKEALRGARAVA